LAGDSVLACIVTSATHLCIASINFSATLDQADSKIQQFHLKDRHKIIDIDSLVGSISFCRQLTLTFDIRIFHLGTRKKRPSTLMMR
jgi:hypothetical protein